MGYWLAVGLLGCGIGALSGCFGVGGGFLLTPALNIFLGLPMNLAVGTSALQVTGTSVLTLRRNGITWKSSGTRLAAAVAIGIPAGAWLGVRLVNRLKAGAPETIDRNLIGIFAVFLFGVGAWLVFDNFHARAGRAVPAGLFRHWRVPPLAHFHCLDGRAFSVSVLVALGFAVGFLGGLLGIGGGVVMLPLLVYFVGVQADIAARIGSVLVLVTGLSSSGFHAWAGNIDYGLAAVLMAGAALGVHAGARLRDRLSHHALLGWFGVVALAAGIGVALQWLSLSGII